MSRKPRLLDLFCGAGGAAMGYHRAGFDVIGVDIKPQPHYPFEFHELDALRLLRDVVQGADWHYRHWGPFDAIHASPPCQAFTQAQRIHGRVHPDLLTPTRPLLEASGLPWVIENVPGAPMRPDVVLCGSMFGEPRLKRHRWFECSPSGPVWPFALLPSCTHDDNRIVSVFGHGGHIYHGVAEWREVMGIDWMTRDELAQAIPPAYTQWLGAQLLAMVEVAA
jgi:DNA (cytosine-5)-methyltransferase 1